jgi:DNA-directed RNA polymerase specialized sigma24 family protein
LKGNDAGVEPIDATRGQLSERLAEASFRRLYADHGRQILAYAQRRAGDPEDAADVVAETFLVAWRRLEDVPPGEQARLWL